MAMIGTTFQPGTDEQMKRRLNQQNQLGPLANEALKILSMRLPDVLSGRPIAPADLLRPRVGGSPPGASGLQSLIGLVNGAIGAPPMSGPGAPPPVVTPGTTRPGPTPGGSPGPVDLTPRPPAPRPRVPFPDGRGRIPPGSPFGY